MTTQERLAQLDRLQKSKLFKMIATGIVIAIGLTIIVYAVMNNTPDTSEFAQRLETIPATVTNFAGEEIENPQLAQIRQIQNLIHNTNPGILLAVTTATVMTMMIMIIWIGLGLVYPVLYGLAIGLNYFLNETRFEVVGSIAVGMIILTMSFMVLMRLASMLTNYSHPVLTIARNVLAEAIRMKISLVFIVMLFFVLAALPMLLDADQSLRYRVQSFLQFSTDFTFAFIAMLVLFFGAATVTYEQREKVIWQTMTKPVAAWQYILGKWLGVVTLAAVLLTVSATGVFLFTEYLRNQTAVGEVAPFQAAEGSDISEDRLYLETQVLASRESVRPTLPFSPNDPVFEDALNTYIENERQLNPGYNPTPAELLAVKNKIFQDEVTNYLSVDPASEQYETFVFNGLAEAKKKNLPLTLRYKINAEGNRPDVFYILTFSFSDGTVLPPRRTGLGYSHTMTLSPEFIDNTGSVSIQILNGQLMPAEDGLFDLQTNINTFTIPPDGLEISYINGGYRANFIRVYFVLWIKIAMLAMLAVWASTFSSFAVSCLIAGGLFFIGQTSGFVQEALPGWGKTNADGDPSVFRTIIYHFADWISSVFKIYNDLRPAERLSDGRMLSWGTVSQGIMAIGGIAAIFYLSAVLIFRKRQLAIYSGQ